MSCQPAVVMGFLIFTTFSLLFLYLYFGVYLQYKVMGGSSHDSMVSVIVAFMAITASVALFSLVLLLRCLLITPDKQKRTVSPVQDKLFEQTIQTRKLSQGGLLPPDLPVTSPSPLPRSEEGVREKVNLENGGGGGGGHSDAVPTIVITNPINQVIGLEY